MLDGMSDSIQGSRIENLHPREVDRQSPTGLIFAILVTRPVSEHGYTIKFALIGQYYYYHVQFPKTIIFMLSASRRQPHLLHVSAVDRRQIWSMDKSWRCVTLSGFLRSHIPVVRCRWNPISCGTHYSGPGLSENDSAVTTDVGEDQNREVELWRLPLKWIDHRSRLPVFPPPTCNICKCLQSGFRDSRRSGGG